MVHHMTYQVLKKINASFIAQFYLGKYSYNQVTFWTHLVFFKKINVSSIDPFCLGK